MLNFEDQLAPEQARSNGGAFGTVSPKFCCVQKKLFWTYSNNKNLAPTKNVFCLPKPSNMATDLLLSSGSKVKPRQKAWKLVRSQDDQLVLSSLWHELQTNHDCIQYIDGGQQHVRFFERYCPFKKSQCRQSWL